MELVNFPPTLVSKVHYHFYLFYSFSSFKPVEKLNWKYVYSLIANGGENYLPCKLYIPSTAKNSPTPISKVYRYLNNCNSLPRNTRCNLVNLYPHVKVRSSPVQPVHHPV